MADYDKSAHDMMRFRAWKYSVFERGRFLVAYHEDRLYSVRDEKRGTVTLVEARDPESAYLKASSIRPISAADVRPVVRGKWEIDNSYAGQGLMNLRCSVCGEFGGTWRDCTLPSMLYKFCPTCGAEMITGKEANGRT